MVAIKLLVLSLVYVCAAAVPYLPPVTRNTIFADERFQGEVFENVDAFDNIELTPRNVAVSPYRLPNTTAPSHYNVLWVINIPAMNYNGAVDITLHATQANVNEIVIHCDHVAVTSVVLRLGTVVVPSTYTLQQEYQFMRVAVTNGVLQYNANANVNYTLRIEFNAEMRDDMYGIYKSWFRNTPTSTESWMATTQFQATAARYAFPCYDEPKFKATFDVTIRRPSTHKSWFCTRVRETRASVFPGYQEDEYHRTPVMSTYLLAIIVAEYDALQAFNQNGLLTHEVIARPNAIATGQGAYAMRAGQDLLAEMSNHTAYDFYTQDANLKMTQAAIPDFGAGAMENWGLLTYREAYLLYDEVHTSSYFKQLIAYILSHEIAHMWFGNLVTNDWWDVLWLNEGFARYYQYFLTAWVEDMGLATRFITEQIHTSLLSDSANNPHPLTNPGVGSPASVSAMFSTITYNKGAAIIRMTEHLLGFDVHRQGLRNYLRLKEFSTAEPIDLFNALEQAGTQAGALTAYGSDFSFVDYYKSWTEQAGHPVLNIQVNHTTGEMTIYQRRFNINTGFSSAHTNYIVPITFTTGASPNFVNTKPSHIISKAVTVINRQVTGDHWVLFNIQQTGFYRVNYDDYTWDLITIALRNTTTLNLIHEYNRAQIVNDVFQFARSGLMSYNRAFNILSFLENETAYTPWVAAMTGFTWLRNRLAGTTQLNELNSRIAAWAGNVMQQITYLPLPNESFMQSYLRFQLAPVMCAINVPACRQSAVTQFTALRTSGTEVPADSRNWVYCNALRDGTQEDFNFLWTRFQTHNVYTEKILLLQTLGCTPHTAALNTFLTNIVTSNFIIRPQDYTTAFNSAVTGNEGNTQIAFTFIQNNLPLVTSAFGSPVTPLSYVSSRLRTVAEVNAFQTWATNNQAALGTSFNAVYNGAEFSRESIQWASAVSSDMDSYFVSGNQAITSSTTTTTVTAAPVTTPQPNLVQPVTPELPTPAPVTDSAVTTFASIFVIALAAIANFVI